MIGSTLAMAGILLYIIFAQKLSIALIVIFHVMFMTGFSMMYNNSMTIGLQQLEVMHIADGNAPSTCCSSTPARLGPRPCP